MIRFSAREMYDIHWDREGEFLILDETIWKKGREYFIKNRSTDYVPVLTREGEFAGFAWQDHEANRELRMLRELEECDEAISFGDLYSDYKSVTIHGCNELAWYFAKYLVQRGITVNVDGNVWDSLGMGIKKKVSACQNYEIWAEGVCQKCKDWREERLRSSSVEFECVNEIYEANIKAGKIKDADGTVYDLLEKLRKEKSIILRGTGTKAQDAYDWLIANGIDICAFQSDRPQNGRRKLFSKPILKKIEVMEQFSNAVIIECASKHSAWGFGDVDTYDYEGYKRNQQYLLLRDYVEIPGNNLRSIFMGKNLIFTGDIRLCNRLYKWFRSHGGISGEIKYWDILEGNKAEKYEIIEINTEELSQEYIYLLVLPEYTNRKFFTKEVQEQYDTYIKKLNLNGIYDYTEYFCDIEKSIHLESVGKKYSKSELRPSGILLGAITPYSGNALLRQSLAGHPQIMMIEGGTENLSAILDTELYSICVRLAEEKSQDILRDFWSIYQTEAGFEAIGRDFPAKEIFHRKMEELLRLGERFTSQELFVMFHIAYETMFGREVTHIENMVIYWEPHSWNRELVREWAYWLESEEVNGVVISVMRNRYIRAGSAMRAIGELNWKDWKIIAGYMYGWEKRVKKGYKYWEDYVIRFEDLKCNPIETLMELCDKLKIVFIDTLLETTWHGKKAFYGSITGYDTRPAYNLYEEYFSSFDRMRICLTAGTFQKRYGYPFVSCLTFSRRELQDMFLKEFRWEKRSGAKEGKTLTNICNLQNSIRHLLWLERYAEIMEERLEERY